MVLLNEIISNFQDWHCQIFEDGSSMHSRQFSGEIHSRLRNNFKSAYNLLSQNDLIIVISCFGSYSNIAIFSES